MNNYVYIFQKGADKYETISKYSYPSCQLYDLTWEEKAAIKTNEYELIKEKCGPDCEVFMIPRVLYDLFVMNFMVIAGDYGLKNIYSENFTDRYMTNMNYNLPVVYDYKDLRNEKDTFEHLKKFLMEKSEKNNMVKYGNSINDFIYEAIQKFREKYAIPADEPIRFNHYFKMMRFLYEKIFIDEIVTYTQNEYEFYCKKLSKANVNINSEINARDISKMREIFNKRFLKIALDRLDGKYNDAQYLIEYESEQAKYGSTIMIMMLEFFLANSDGDGSENKPVHPLLENLKIDKNIVLFFLNSKRAKRILMYLFCHLFTQGEFIKEIIYNGNLYKNFRPKPQCLLNTLDFTRNYNYSFPSFKKIYKTIETIFSELFMDSGGIKQNDDGSYSLATEKTDDTLKYINDKISDNKYKYFYTTWGNGKDVMALLGNVLIYELFPKKNIDKNCVLLYRAINFNKESVVCKPKLQEDDNEHEELPFSHIDIMSHLLSFNTSIFNAFFFDFGACTFYYMLREQYHYIYYTEKVFAKDNERKTYSGDKYEYETYDDEDEDEFHKEYMRNLVRGTNGGSPPPSSSSSSPIRFDELFYIPPLTPLEQLMGSGGFFHVRTKAYHEKDRSYERNYLYEYNCGVYTNTTFLMKYLQNNMTKDEMVAEFDEYIKRYRRDIAQELLDRLSHKTIEAPQTGETPQADETMRPTRSRRSPPTQTQTRKKSKSKSRSKSITPDPTIIP